MSESERSQKVSCAEQVQDGSPGRNPPWHKLLLNNRSCVERDTDLEEASGPDSLLSNATETNEGGLIIEGEYAILNTLRNETSGNYDSGNFSFSESSKGKTAVSPGGHDLHHRFVQLNTELYQAKTELLTYKYKWNEIRNEVELQWNKKFQRIVDEKLALQQEVEDLQAQVQRVVDIQGVSGGCESNLEILKLRSDQDHLRIQLDCKDRANRILKEKIAEQYCDKENLSLDLKKREKILVEVRNELSSVRSSESWFRNELHACQNVNAKLKETNLLLQNKLSLGKAQRDRLRVELQQVIRNAEEIERGAIKEKEELLVKLKSIEASNLIDKVSDLVLDEYSSKLIEASTRITILTESNKNLHQERGELQSKVHILNNTLSNQEALIQSCKSKESEAITRITMLEVEKTQLNSGRVQALQENTELHTALARQSFAKRDLDVSIEHLRAQLKVLSINFENTRHAYGVKEFALQKLQQEFHGLEERYREAEQCRTELEAQLRMSESLAAERYEQLLDNFRTIQSKNLDLELKLGQWAAHNEKFKKSEEVVHQLRQDIAELQGRIEQDASISSKMATSSNNSSSCSRLIEKSAKKSSTCPKHGNVIPEDDTRELKILLRVIENENRQKLKRYELNNRTLLKKVNEHGRARMLAEQQVEALEKNVCKMSSLKCELAGMREKNILLEADLDSVLKECNILKGEKTRLISVLQNNSMLAVDEDIWDSFQRIFADLRDTQRIHKENGRLKELLEISEAKILELEEELKRSLSFSEEKSTVIENLKLATELQKVESDDIRSELTVKTIQLEESQRMVTDLSSERSSLQDSIGGQQLSEGKLREEIDFLQKQLQISVVQLESAYDRLKLFEESERILADSRHRFFDDIQILRDEIIAEKQEKQELQEVVRALKENMMQMVECNMKSYHSNSHPDSTSNAPSSLGSSSNHSTGSEHATTPPVKFNEDALKALVEECSRRNHSLRPLQECVASLRTEMNNLNAVVRQNGQQRYHVVSLMEELQDATNGTYNSR